MTTKLKDAAINSATKSLLANGGYCEWGGAMFMSLSTASYETANQYTDGELDRINEARQTAQKSVTVGRFYNAFSHQFGSVNEAAKDMISWVYVSSHLSLGESIM